VDVEKTIEFILNMQANAEVEMQKIREAQAQADARLEAHATRHDREMEKHDRRLRQAVRLAIQEARNERKRRQQANEEFDVKITQLAAAHLETEAALKSFVESMRRGGNGNQ
jgi:hypothetical protein